MDENLLVKERSPQGCKITKTDLFLSYMHISVRISAGMFTVRIGRRKWSEKHAETLII